MLRLQDGGNILNNRSGSVVSNPEQVFYVIRSSVVNCGLDILTVKFINVQGECIEIESVGFTPPLLCSDQDSLRLTAEIKSCHTPCIS